ncbi:MAG TPA: response regulator [Sedimentisphaerales bacterium]|nr:response regulator [Sedimentisphaerales bacterium]
MPKPILLVEDDRVYAIWVRNALNKLDVPNKLVHAANGKLALEYLRDKANTRPCLILLDLYMPELNGVEFLRVIKSDCALKHIPVVVLTASPQEGDVAMSFELGAAEYLKKGNDYSDLLYKMSRLLPYWTGIQSSFDPEPAPLLARECV